MKKNTIFFSTTNIASQRYNFFNYYFDVNSIYFNLMSSNKLKAIFRNTFLYIILFVPTFIFLLINLIFKDLRKIKNIIVPFPGVLDLLFLYPFCKLFKINLIYDVFVNFEQTLIDDRKLVNNKTFKQFLKNLDFLYIFLSDYLIVETIQIKEYYVENYGIDEEKIIVILSPREINYKNLKNLDFEQDVVLYFGSYVPLNGTEFIVEAANILRNKNIKFLMIGDGQDKLKCLKLVKKYNLNNVEFLDTLPFSSDDPKKSLQNYINSSKLILGTFSTSKKNDQVIPGKVVDALALGKKVITSSNPCIEHYLRDCVITVKSGSSMELANKITEALETNLYDHVSGLANQTYKKLFSREIFEKNIELELQKI